MASVRANSGDTYDLARGLRLYEAGGPLAERAAALWRHLAPSEMTLARAFWLRYRQSEEVKGSIADDKIEELAMSIFFYLALFIATCAFGWSSKGGRKSGG